MTDLPPGALELTAEQWAWIARGQVTLTVHTDGRYVATGPKGMTAVARSPRLAIEALTGTQHRVTYSAPAMVAGPTKPVRRCSDCQDSHPPEVAHCPICRKAMPLYHVPVVGDDGLAAA